MEMVLKSAKNVKLLHRFYTIFVGNNSIFSVFLQTITNQHFPQNGYKIFYPN